MIPISRRSVLAGATALAARPRCRCSVTPVSRLSGAVSISMAPMTIQMKGMTPENIWLMLTCFGATPFR